MLFKNLKKTVFEIRGGFEMRFYGDLQSPIPGIFHFGLDRKIWDLQKSLVKIPQKIDSGYGDLGFLTLKNPQSKSGFLKSRDLYPLGLRIFEVLGILSPGFYGDGDFLSWDWISNQKATSVSKS